MSRTSKKLTCLFMLGLGLGMSGLVACGEDSSKKESKKAVVEPVAFTELRQLDSLADTLSSFTGTVVFPSEKDVAVHGRMNGDLPEFMKFLQERKTGLNYIYRKHQKLKPGFEGNIALDITVDVCGDVFSVAEISSTTDNPEFNTEIKNSLSRQKFPTTTQGHYTVSFALDFVKEAPAEEIAEAAAPEAVADTVAPADSVKSDSVVKDTVKSVKKKSTAKAKASKAPEKAAPEPVAAPEPAKKKSKSRSK